MRLAKKEASGDRRILTALRQIKAFTKEPHSDCNCTLLVGELLRI
ncbi:hypothetical protein [Rhizobium mesosinicum]|nr:hypothetical protein [Rhizobium mesosinicum]